MQFNRMVKQLKKMKGNCSFKQIEYRHYKKVGQSFRFHFKQRQNKIIKKILDLYFVHEIGMKPFPRHGKDQIDFYP